MQFKCKYIFVIFMQVTQALKSIFFLKTLCPFAVTLEKSLPQGSYWQ